MHLNPTINRPRSPRLNHDSPLTEPNKKIDNNLGEYIVLKNTSGRNLALGDVQVGQGGNWWQFSATDTLVPNAYALVCYGTVVDQAQFLSANNLPIALTTDPTVQWHWQSTIDFPDAEGQATVRLFENGKPGQTLDQVYWNPDGLQAINAYCDATCQINPNREAVVSLQLDDYTYDPINPWDASKWTTAEATAKGKGSSQPEGPTAVRGLLKKEYELKDHLGNVHVVVTDRKHSTIGAGPSIGEFKADVVVMRDYYPFGMEMEGQSYVGGDYRYGFNGMERDDEMKGRGDSYDFGARMYDPRVGRFLSVDPKARKLPFWNPYVFTGNSPVVFIDKNGFGPGIYRNNSSTVIVLSGDSHSFRRITKFDGAGISGNRNGPPMIICTGVLRGQIILNPGDVFESKTWEVNNEIFQGGVITRSDGKKEEVKVYDIDFVDVKDEQRFVIDTSPFWFGGDKTVEGEGPEFNRKTGGPEDSYVPPHEIINPIDPTKISEINPDKGEIKLNTSVTRVEFKDEQGKIRIDYGGSLLQGVQIAQPKD